MTVYGSLTISLNRSDQQSEGLIDQNANPCYPPVSLALALVSALWPWEHFPPVQNGILLGKTKNTIITISQYVLTNYMF